MKAVRNLVIIAGLVVALVFANNSIRVHQEIVDAGKQILLELRPVYPRSLIQGDYMRLAYSASTFPPPYTQDAGPSRGTFVMSVDENGVATFARLDNGDQLGPNEVRLQFERWDTFRGPSVGAESFYFQEGHAEFYADARYGVLRVNEHGTSVLVGLADDSYQLITPPADE